MTGLIDGSERGVWKLATEPVGTESGSTITVEQSHTANGGDEHTPPPLEVLPLPAEFISQELQAASIDSSNSERLKRAVADPMRFFGFEVEEIGGPGRTDVLAVAPLGISRFSVVLDAKASAKGKVTEAQIDWLAIQRHRSQERADFAVLVGSAFAGGQLQSHAKDFGVSLLKIDELVELVGLHAIRPLSLVDLRAVIESVPFASEALPGVREAVINSKRRINLISFLLESIQRFNKEAPDTVMAKPDVLHGLVVASTDPGVRGASASEVSDTLAMLETVGILSNPNEDGYISQTSLSCAYQMLTHFGQLGHTDISGDQGAQETDISRSSSQGRRVGC